MFSDEQCAALVRAIAAHDEIDMGAALPCRVHLDYDARLLERCYWLSYRLWAEFDQAALARLAARLSFGRGCSAADAHALRDVRARAKQLRFARATMGADHGYPPMLNRVTRLMGKAQDAARAGRRMELALRGAVLRLLLTTPGSAALAREARTFVATDPDAFRHHVLDRIDAMRATLAGPAVTDKAFHEMRKVVSQLVAFYDTLTVLAPSDYHRAVDRYLSTINGMMGAIHDEMIERRAANRRGYHLVAKPLPRVVAVRLRQLADAFPAR